MAIKQSSKPRKSKSSSIYRGIERLLGDILSIAERTPKKAQGLQALSVRMVNETLEALSITELALNCPNLDQRIAFIGALVHSMTIIKSATRQMYMYSRRNYQDLSTNDKGELEITKTPSYGRIISNKQYFYLLSQFSKLGEEIQKWFHFSHATRSSQGEVNQKCD